MIINGEEYAWDDMSIVLFGRVVEGIVAISYTQKREVKHIHGRGSNPVALSRGKKTPEASITLLQSELEAIQLGLPRGQDLTDIAPFEIPVAYAPVSGIKKVDILQGVRFTEVPKSMGSDNPTMTVVLPLAVTRIKYNV